MVSTWFRGKTICGVAKCRFFFPSHINCSQKVFFLWSKFVSRYHEAFFLMTIHIFPFGPVFGRLVRVWVKRILQHQRYIFLLIWCLSFLCMRVCQNVVLFLLTYFDISLSLSFFSFPSFLKAVFLPTLSSVFRMELWLPNPQEMDKFHLQRASDE